MKICVVGAGVIGLTTAYFLARSGHAVTIVERNGSPAQETSYANGGQLSYSYVAPLAAPSIFPSLPKYLLDPKSPLAFRLRADPRQWRWLFEFIRACGSNTFNRHTAELSLLAGFSHTAMRELMQSEPLDFDFNRHGKLVIHRDRKSFEGAVALATYQKDLGADQVIANADECIALEPALEGLRGQFVGGIFTPSEEAGDCHKFCVALETILREKYGVTTLYHHGVGSLRSEGKVVRALSTARGDIEADRFIIAAGLASRELVRPIGLSLPLCGLKGYSLTVTLSDDPPLQAPKISVTDSQKKIVYARLGRSLRIAAMVDIGAKDSSVDPVRISTLKHQAQATFPQLTGVETASCWAGERPATAHGKPILGRTPFRNLFLNVGHGALGFTLAAGCGKLLADSVNDAVSALDEKPFSLGVVR